MQTGNRWQGRGNPGDLTRKRQQELLREKVARDEAASIDVNEVHKQAFAAGIDAGWEAGFAAGWDALADFLTDQGLDVAAIIGLADEPDDTGDE